LQGKITHFTEFIEPLIMLSSTLEEEDEAIGSDLFHCISSLMQRQQFPLGRQKPSTGSRGTTQALGKDNNAIEYCTTTTSKAKQKRWRKMLHYFGITSNNGNTDAIERIRERVDTVASIVASDAGEHTESVIIGTINRPIEKHAFNTIL
jgi:hypothetical protein